MKDIYRIRKDGGKAWPAPVLEAIDLSQEVVETKRENAKLVDRNIDLVVELYKSHLSERLARDGLQKAEACVNAMKKLVKVSGSKYLEIVKDAAQVAKEFRMRVTSLKSEHEVEKDCIVRFEEARVGENAEGRDINVA